MNSDIPEVLELTPYKKLSKCRICDKPAHGYHHGALTCRACCAFFRKCAANRDLEVCQHPIECKNSEKGYSCKKCRIVKCFKVGMTMKKFQHGRDLISNRELTTIKSNAELPMSLEKFLGRPHVIIRCEPKSSKSERIFLDFSKLLEKAENILSKKTKTKAGMETPNCLEKLASHMKNMRQVKPHGNIVYRKVGKKEILMFWELDFCRTAEWLANFDEFQKLSITLRMEFLKTIWNLWATLEKVALTAEKRVKQTNSSTVALDDKAALDAENLEIDLSWCTDYEQDKIKYFLLACHDFVQMKSAVEVLIALQPTDVEVNFMILEVCFSYAGKRHQGELLEIAEKLLETVSNQMHDYYSNVLKISNYASRLSKLMKCGKIIQDFTQSRRQKIEIGRIFDIFNLQYSHPEMFTTCGY